MANTVLSFGETHVRLNYWRLQNVLRYLDETAPEDAPARRLIDPWLAHINEDLGYVKLDDRGLRDASAVSDLIERLAPATEAFETGTVPLSQDQQEFSKNDPDGFAGLMATSAEAGKSLHTFLSRVERDLKPAA